MALIRCLPILGLTLALIGCSTTQEIRPHEVNAVAFAPWSDAPVAYRLGAGDKVKVGYLLTPELDEEVTVAPDGYVGLRAAGRVPAQNLTIDEFQRQVQAAAARNLRNPVVTVGVTDAHSARIIVGGAVEKPGVYPLPPRGSPFEAVTLAGGLLPESRMTQVVVLRRRPDNSMMMRTVNLNRFVADADANQSVALASEDIIFVPRSRVAEVNLWISQNIDKNLPFTRSVNYTYTNDGAFIP